MRVVPISLKIANAYVDEHHRHHKSVTGHKFSVGCENDGVLVGVAIAGRPVSRHLDDGTTLEVNRLCTDGTRNACSFLYSAVARIAKKWDIKKWLHIFCNLKTVLLFVRLDGSAQEKRAGKCGQVQENQKRHYIHKK